MENIMSITRLLVLSFLSTRNTLAVCVTCSRRSPRPSWTIANTTRNIAFIQMTYVLIHEKHVSCLCHVGKQGRTSSLALHTRLQATARDPVLQLRKGHLQLHAARRREFLVALEHLIQHKRVHKEEHLMRCTVLLWQLTTAWLNCATSALLVLVLCGNVYIIIISPDNNILLSHWLPWKSDGWPSADCAWHRQSATVTANTRACKIYVAKVCTCVCVCARASNAYTWVQNCAAMEGKKYASLTAATVSLSVCCRAPLAHFFKWLHKYV